MPKPADYPEWAMDDVQDNISQQYNVVEPPDEKKLTGWALLEKPNRQWWNWLQRTICDWIIYFDENLDFESDTFVPVWAGLDFASIITNYGFYSREGDKLYYTIHVTWNANAAATPLACTNMPFVAKNAAGFIQSAHISRGVGPTLNNGYILSALIGANSDDLLIWGEDATTGAGAQIAAAGASGQLIISGFYFIEPTP